MNTVNYQKIYQSTEELKEATERFIKVWLPLSSLSKENILSINNNDYYIENSLK